MASQHTRAAGWPPGSPRGLESPFAEETLWEPEDKERAGLEWLAAETPFREGDLRAREAETAPVLAPEKWDSEDYYNERAPDEFLGEEPDGERGREAIEAEAAAEIPAAIAETAARLGRERALHSRRAPSDEESALLHDYRDTLTGAHARWGKRYARAPFTVEAIGRAWMISREQETRFKYSSSPVRPLQGFAPPGERVALAAHPLVGSSDKAPVAPVVGSFAEELKRRYPGMRAENYRGHGGGSFADRGYSLDLYIKGKDERGFFPADDALAFLRAVHEAAGAVNAQWRVIYNDFTVADAMNRATGQRNVIFVGTVFRDRNRAINGINWHGPDPLILHFHLDLAPRAGARPPAGPLQSPMPAPAAAAKPGAELVRFAQRVLNAAEGERLAVDGDLGPRTRAALERFRKRYTLGAGGALDANTELALAQRALEELAQQSLFQPGVRDAQTEQALRNFKASRGLLPVAVLDAATRAALAGAIERSRGGQHEAGASEHEAQEQDTMDFDSPAEEAFDVNQRQAATGNRPTLTQGSRGTGVRELQLRLQTVTKYKIKVDGIFGPETREALVLFQEKHRLNPDGVAGRRTWDALVPVSSGPALDAPVLQRVIAANNQANERARVHDHAGALKIGQNVYADPALALKPEMRGVVAFNMGTDHHSLRAFDEAIRCYTEAICAPGGSDDQVPLGLERIREARLRLPPTPTSELRRRWTQNVAADSAPQRAAESEGDLHLELFAGDTREDAHAAETQEEHIDAEPLEEAESESHDEEDREALDEQDEGAPEAGELEPALSDIAERTMAREASEFEELAAARWTTCFSAADVARVKSAYQDNDKAAQANSGDRCSCIVMLNVGLGQLLSLPTKSHPARGSSTRTVDMAQLTTESIDKAMAALVKNGYATGPTAMNFYDLRNRTAGTLKPVKLKKSVQSQVLSLASTKGCWFAFGLSVMDGYHSVLLLVDRTSTPAKIFWLDQFSVDLTDDVTSSLDQRITDKTQAWWQAVMDSKGKGYNTTIRLWRLRKRRKKS